MKILPLLAALPLLCASVVSANTLMSVGYFNGGGDVTAGPGGDIDKLDVRQITHLNYSFGLVYNDEKDETNAALKDPSKLHQIWLSPKVQADLQKIPSLRQQNPSLKVLLSVGGWGARGFSGAAATKETRAVFIQSALAIIEKYGLDGIDLDWEYPVNGAWEVPLIEMPYHQPGSAVVPVKRMGFPGSPSASIRPLTMISTFWLAWTTTPGPIESVAPSTTLMLLVTL